MPPFLFVREWVLVGWDNPDHSRKTHKKAVEQQNNRTHFQSAGFFYDPIL